MFKHCAANRKRRLSALPNVGLYIYDVKISSFTRCSIYDIYDISRLRVKLHRRDFNRTESNVTEDAAVLNYSGNVLLNSGVLSWLFGLSVFCYNCNY
jgi:hypothetical protein